MHIKFFSMVKVLTTARFKTSYYLLECLVKKEFFGCHPFLNNELLKKILSDKKIIIMIDCMRNIFDTPLLLLSQLLIWSK